MRMSSEMTERVERTHDCNPESNISLSKCASDKIVATFFENSFDLVKACEHFFDCLFISFLSSCETSPINPVYESETASQLIIRKPIRQKKQIRTVNIGIDPLI